MLLYRMSAPSPFLEENTMTLPFLMVLSLLLTGISILFETAFLKRRMQGNHWVSLGYKVLAAAGFCGIALLTALYVGSYWGYLILFGLFMGLIGDFLLALRKVSKKHHDLFLFLGAMVFSAGNLFYISALHHLRPYSLYQVFPVFLILMACAESFLLVHRVRKPQIHIPALLYIAIEAYMSATALILAYSRTGLGTLFFVTGSFSFFASDNLLCAYSFGDLKSREIDYALHITYISAQLLIAWSILFL